MENGVARSMTYSPRLGVRQMPTEWRSKAFVGTHIRTNRIAAGGLLLQVTSRNTIPNSRLFPTQLHDV